MLDSFLENVLHHCPEVDNPESILEAKKGGTFAGLPTQTKKWQPSAIGETTRHLRGAERCVRGRFLKINLKRSKFGIKFGMCFFKKKGNYFKKSSF